MRIYWHHFPEVALDLTVSSHMLRRLSFPRGGEITVRQDSAPGYAPRTLGSTRAAPV